MKNPQVSDKDLNIVIEMAQILNKAMEENWQTCCLAPLDDDKTAMAAVVVCVDPKEAQLVREFVESLPSFRNI